MKKKKLFSVLWKRECYLNKEETINTYIVAKDIYKAIEKFYKWYNKRFSSVDVPSIVSISEVPKDENVIMHMPDNYNDIFKKWSECGENKG